MHEMVKQQRQKQPELEGLWPHCSHNRYALSGSAKAGCFYCLEIWEPGGTEIAEWVDCDDEADDEIGNATAMCPFCGIDSVLASINIDPITPELLQEMHDYWF